MASVDTASPYLLRGTFSPSTEKKSKIRNIILENPLFSPFEYFKIEVSAYKSKWKSKKIFNKEIDPNRVPLEIVDLKDDKKRKIYIVKTPPLPEAATPLALYKTTPDPNKPIPLPPTQHYAKLKEGRYERDLAGIPRSEIERIKPLVDDLLLILPPSDKFQQFTLKYYNSTYTLFLDTRPGGIDPFIRLPKIGEGSSKTVFKGIDLRSLNVVVYTFAVLADEYKKLNVEVAPNIFKTKYVLSAENYLPAVCEQEIIGRIEAQKIERKASHPRLVRYYTVANLNVYDPKRMLVLPMQIAMMKLENKGDSYTHIVSHSNVLSAHTFTKVLLDLFKGLAFLHSFGIIHKDLKLENLFLHYSKKGQLKLKIGDFGFAGMEGKFCGSPCYISPEFIQKIIKGYFPSRIPIVECNPEKLHTTASDVYSVSVILFSMLTLRFPLLSQSMNWICNSRSLDESTYNNTLNAILLFLREHPSRLALEQPKFDLTTVEKSMPTPIRMKYRTRELTIPLQTDLKANILYGLYARLSALQPHKRISAQEAAETIEKHSKQVEYDVGLIRKQLDDFHNLYDKPYII